MAEATERRGSFEDRERRAKTYIYTGRGAAYRTEGRGVRSKQVPLKRGDRVKLLPEELGTLRDRFVPEELWDRPSHAAGEAEEQAARRLEEREARLAEREREVDAKAKAAEEGETRVRLAERDAAQAAEKSGEGKQGGKGK